MNFLSALPIRLRDGRLERVLAAANPMPLPPPVMTATVPWWVWGFVVLGRGSFLPSRGAALRHHACGAQFWDLAIPVPDHTAVRHLATGEAEGRGRGGSVVADRG